jgi:hypothetical protein
VCAQAYPAAPSAFLSAHRGGSFASQEDDESVHNALDQRESDHVAVCDVTHLMREHRLGFALISKVPWSFPAPRDVLRGWMNGTLQWRAAFSQRPTFLA